MLDILGQKVHRNCQGVGRRDFLRVGALGVMGLTLADWFKMKAQGATVEGKAKAVIHIWWGGGQTHLETFDPKPEAGEDYCGPFKNPIETNVVGTRIGHLLPLMAKQADKYSILRTFNTGSSGHEVGTYIVQTGTMPSADLSYPPLGSVVAQQKGGQGGLPPFVTLLSPMYRISQGFLGNDYASYVAAGDPNSNGFTPQGLTAPSGMTTARLQGRRTLLQAVDSLAKRIEKQQDFEAMSTYQQQAFDVITGKAKKAFDLSQEKEELRERYGRNGFGQACLLARRLVENGVRYVTINWGGWDHHSYIFKAMENMLPTLDRGFATLIEDLYLRGLLDSTIVVSNSEFGRVPKISWEPPWHGGRHHWHYTSSCIVAGGGFRGGAVVGESDEKGEYTKNRPVHAWDLAASMYQLLGIDYAGKLPHPQGCGVASVTPVATGEVQSGGLLTEIM